MDRGTRISGIDHLFIDRADRATTAAAVGYPDPASYGAGARASAALKKSSQSGFGSGFGESSADAATWSAWAAGGESTSSSLPAKPRGGAARGRATSYY